ncbi:Hypothetical predicted protein [Xyrichtys novacula]|uniref:Uncharacterized protein n=1 Tax=Xyrichtys novacula TaxID=13765 RepID=A0AAV1EV33_XYRNO|nr:Hypothetical predicted protein [Xyrichtys novacula]
MAPPAPLPTTPVVATSNTISEQLKKTLKCCLCSVSTIYLGGRCTCVPRQATQLMKAFPKHARHGELSSTSGAFSSSRLFGVRPDPHTHKRRAIYTLNSSGSLFSQLVGLFAVDIAHERSEGRRLTCLTCAPSSCVKGTPLVVSSAVLLGYGDKITSSVGA